MVDFDYEFVRRLLKEIFSKLELKKSAGRSTTTSVLELNRRKLRFAKGEVNQITPIYYHNVLTTILNLPSQIYY